MFSFADFVVTNGGEPVVRAKCGGRGGGDHTEFPKIWVSEVTNRLVVESQVSLHIPPWS